jgi:hypothetical protein
MGMAQARGACETHRVQEERVCRDHQQQQARTPWFEKVCGNFVKQPRCMSDAGRGDEA